jgi:hypothetical protein
MQLLYKLVYEGVVGEGCAVQVQSALDVT